jgi:hypothetical protein
LPHIAVDEHNVAALRQAERGLGLALKFDQIALT